MSVDTTEFFVLSTLDEALRQRIVEMKPALLADADSTGTAKTAVTVNGMAVGTVVAAFKAAPQDTDPGRFSKQAFSATGNERSMVGLLIGCAVQKRLYTKKDGTDGEGLEVAFTLPADDVRTGNHKELPAPRDTRQGTQNGAQGAQAQSQAPQGYEPEIIPF